MFSQGVDNVVACKACNCEASSEACNCEASSRPIMMDSCKPFFLKMMNMCKAIGKKYHLNSIKILWVGCGLGEELIPLILFCLLNDVHIHIDAIDHK